MDDLSEILWRERELLERLARELEVERLVRASDRTYWLVDGNRPAEVTLDQLRVTEVLRAVGADAAALRLGLPPGPTLAALALAAGEPERADLLDHRAALSELVREIVERGAAGGTPTLRSLLDFLR